MSDRSTTLLTVVYRDALIVTAVAELGTAAVADMVPRYTWIRVPFVEPHHE